MKKYHGAKDLTKPTEGCILSQSVSSCQFPVHSKLRLYSQPTVYAREIRLHTLSYVRICTLMEKVVKIVELPARAAPSNLMFFLCDYLFRPNEQATSLG